MAGQCLGERGNTPARALPTYVKVFTISTVAVAWHWPPPPHIDRETNGQRLSSHNKNSLRPNYLAEILINKWFIVDVNPCLKIGHLDDRPMSWQSLVKLGPCSRSRRKLSVGPHPLKLHGETCYKSSITQPQITRFRSNFVHSLNWWRQKCSKSSRSRVQRSRSQRDRTCAEIRKIINNSAGNSSISLKYQTDFDHVTLDVPRTFKLEVGSWARFNVPRPSQPASGTNVG